MQLTHTTTILLLALVVQTGCDEDKSSMPNFSHYQQTRSLQEIIQWQTNAVWQIGQMTNILAISDFDYGNDRVVSQYFISESGKGWSWRNVTAWAMQPGKKIKQSLSETELKSLGLAIKEFPSQNSAPPLERLVIVSFKSGTNWVTHTCDRRSMPKAMLNICEIADLGIETKTQK